MQNASDGTNLLLLLLLLHCVMPHSVGLLLFDFGLIGAIVAAAMLANIAFHIFVLFRVRAASMFWQLIPVLLATVLTRVFSFTSVHSTLASRSTSARTHKRFVRTAGVGVGVACSRRLMIVLCAMVRRSASTWTATRS